MSASDSARGHAVHADGGLKDATEMDWSYNQDDSVPFPLDSLTNPDDAVASPALASVGPHPFFTHAKPPAAIVAGSHHSTCPSRPSQHMREVNNVPELSTRAKRKAAVNLSPAPVCRTEYQVVIDSDGNKTEHDGNVTEPDGNVTEPDGNKTEPAMDEDGNNADVSSQSLQAKADADHEVSFCYHLLNHYLYTIQAVHFKSKEDSTADVCLIFQCEKQYMNPDN